MRPQNKRGRGRNGGGGNPYQHNNNPNRGPRPPQRSQTFDSNGPSVKIRGNAYQVFERYLALAREAQSSGDRIAAENFYQHAEHYFRMMNAQGEGFQGQPRPQHQTPWTATCPKAATASSRGTTSSRQSRCKCTMLPRRLRLRPRTTNCPRSSPDGRISGSRPAAALTEVNESPVSAF